MFMENEASLSSVKKRLHKYEEAGIKLYLDGNLSDADHIYHQCVREDTEYMADYVMDEQGKVKEIRYDEISGANPICY